MPIFNHFLYSISDYWLQDCNRYIRTRKKINKKEKELTKSDEFFVTLKEKELTKSDGFSITLKVSIEKEP